MTSRFFLMKKPSKSFLKINVKLLNKKKLINLINWLNNAILIDII